MHYEALAKDCRWLGIHTQDFRDPQTLALALERKVDAGNAPKIVMMLEQIASDEFDIAHARRAYEGLRLELRMPKFASWKTAGAEKEAEFLCGSELQMQQFRGWLASIDEPMALELRGFFESAPHRFTMTADPFSAADRLSVRLGVRDAAMELVYSLPDRFELDHDPARARATACSLLRHLKIGTLYHELLTAARDGGIDATRILDLLSQPHERGHSLANGTKEESLQGQGQGRDQKTAERRARRN